MKRFFGYTLCLALTVLLSFAFGRTAEKADTGADLGGMSMGQTCFVVGYDGVVPPAVLSGGVVVPSSVNLARRVPLNFPVLSPADSGRDFYRTPKVYQQRCVNSGNLSHLYKQQSLYYIYALHRIRI